MFAGLPGIGVGTLFYVLTALWMPFPEVARLVRGDSSLARWRVIGVQVGYALSIIASIAAAERVLVWILDADSSGAANPARLVHRGMTSLSPETLLAAPIMASVLLLALILLAVQVQYWAQRLATGRSRRQPRRAVSSASGVSPFVAPTP